MSLGVEKAAARPGRPSQGVQLFDALPPHIEAALRESIARFGVLVPVFVDQDGGMLDGHHRARIADELGAPYERIVLTCADAAERREIARTLNADRRQLTEEQRRAVAVALRPEHSLRAIGGALGVSATQVQRDLAGVTDVTPERVTGLDGKSYPASRPAPVAAPVDDAMWDSLVAVIDAIEGLAGRDAASIAATVPSRRRAATATRLRKLGTYLGHVARLLEEGA
jgi:hypothetical protein